MRLAKTSVIATAALLAFCSAAIAKTGGTSCSSGHGCTGTARATSATTHAIGGSLRYAFTAQRHAALTGAMRQTEPQSMDALQTGYDEAQQRIADRTATSDDFQAIEDYYAAQAAAASSQR